MKEGKAKEGKAMKVHKATRKEIVQIHARLAQVMLLDRGEGYCAYPDDVSDATIANELGVPVGSVALTRRDIFGRLRGMRTANQLDDITQQLDECVRVVTNLTACYDDLKSRHDKLCMTLTINRVAECNHLKTGAAPRLNGEGKP